MHTPILPVNAPMKGFVYIAKQNENPFGRAFLALYLVIEEPERGLLVKIPGRIDLDPVTGQITTTFDNLPQFPVSDFQITLKGGVRAAPGQPLARAGPRRSRRRSTRWQDPNTPHTVTNSYPVTERPDGSPCVNGLGERPFAPSALGRHALKRGRRLLLAVLAAPDEHRRRPGVLPARPDDAPGRLGEARGRGPVP